MYAEFEYVQGTFPTYLLNKIYGLIGHDMVPIRPDLICQIPGRQLHQSLGALGSDIWAPCAPHSHLRATARRRCARYINFVVLHSFGAPWEGGPS